MTPGAHGVDMKRYYLISDELLEQNRRLHSGKGGFGGSGWRRAEDVAKFAQDIGAVSVLDYGCGEGTLKKELQKRLFPGTVTEYDPAVKGKEACPEYGSIDLVVCTDVLEHVEPQLLPNVIEHLCKLAKRGCFLVIATRPANKLLPDGRNAHLIIKSPKWWLHELAKQKWNIEQHVVKVKGDGSPHEVAIWLTK